MLNVEIMDCYFEIKNPAESRQIQRRLFRAGFKWVIPTGVMDKGESDGCQFTQCKYLFTRYEAKRIQVSNNLSKKNKGLFSYTSINDLPIPHEFYTIEGNYYASN